MSNLHHFPAFLFFKTSFFLAEKKSIGDMAHIWRLKTAYTNLLSNKTHDQLISCLCVFLLASESALPPSFSCIFMFQTKHFSSRKKIYWRYGPHMASKNCLHYSSYKLNPWSVNIMSLWYFISIWVSPPPFIFMHFNFLDQTFFKQKKNLLEKWCIDVF